MNGYLPGKNEEMQELVNSLRNFCVFLRINVNLEEPILQCAAERRNQENRDIKGVTPS